MRYKKFQVLEKTGARLFQYVEVRSEAGEVFYSRAMTEETSTPEAHIEADALVERLNAGEEPPEAIYSSPNYRWQAD